MSQAHSKLLKRFAEQASKNCHSLFRSFLKTGEADALVVGFRPEGSAAESLHRYSRHYVRIAANESRQAVRQNDLAESIRTLPDLELLQFKLNP
jgi:hypothetical protein